MGISTALEQLRRVVGASVVGGQRAALAAAVLVPACIANAQADRINDTPTGWWYYYGATTAGIDAQMSVGHRPFNIGYTGGNYDTILVENSGEYAATGMDAYWDMSTSNIALSLGLSNNRIIDLEVANSLTGTFSAVVVDNSGATAATGWDWETGLTFTGMVNWQAANGLRPIDVDQYSTLAGTRYSIVAVPNTGNNHQSGWWWDFGITEAQVTSFLTSRSARLIDIDIYSTSPLTFNAIMVSENPGLGVWHPGLTSSQVSDFINQNGVRLTCLQRYTNSAGATRFAIAGVDNVNAQTRRMRSYFSSRADDGVWGFRLKEVGGPVLASLNEDYEYHPASMIKVLYATYAIDRCASNLDDLDNTIATPSCASSCPDSGSCGSINETLDNAMRLMMRDSDNLRTKAIENRYSRTTLNNYADTTLSLDSTQVNTTIGCFCVTSTTGNDMTARDGVSIYEKIADGSLFSDVWKETLFDIMVNLEDYGYDTYDTLAAVIDQEAASTNLTATEINSFKGQMRFAHKAGGSVCGSTNLAYSTQGGWASIPFKVLLLGNYVVLPREYALTLFHTDYTDSAADSIPGSAREEILREQIREALESWDSACTTPAIINQPDNTAAFEGEDATFQIGLGVGTGSRTYRWQVFDTPTWFNLNDLNTFYSGTTTNTLHVLSVHESDQGLYRCVVTSPCGTTTSTSAILSVNPPPTGCDSIDFNGDGLFPDVQDIADFIGVFGGLPCPTGPGQCGDIDFNNDGLFPDTQDIATFISVFGGGPCQ